MPQIPKPYTFVGNTPAIANEVNANFDAILSVLNGNIDEANLKPFTVNQDLEPTADVAQINLLLSWIVNRLVNITGNADWKDDVAKNLREHRNDSPIDHPDGSVTDAKIGTRTIDDTVVPPGNILQLAAALSALANRIKAITGAATWRDAPATTLAALRLTWIPRATSTTPRQKTLARLGPMRSTLMWPPTISTITLAPEASRYRWLVSLRQRRQPQAV